MVSDQITNDTSSAVASGEHFGLSLFLSLCQHIQIIQVVAKRKEAK